MTDDEKPESTGRKKPRLVSSLLATQVLTGTDTSFRDQRDPILNPVTSGTAQANQTGAAQGTPHAPPKRPIYYSQVRSIQKETQTAVPISLRRLSNWFPFNLGKTVSLIPRDDPAALAFNPGRLDEPSMEGSLRDVDITYAVNPPFQYVRVHYDETEKALWYTVIEPQLTAYEVTTLEIIERAFERLITTTLRAVTDDDREFYLKERFDSIINIFRLDVSDLSKERLFFHLKKKYLGYGRIDTLMKDKYIEDISCNGSNLPIYLVHRAYGSIQTNISIGEVELNNFVMRLAQMGSRHISLLQPIRDVTLPDGSRANITLSGEVTKKGSTFTIRKFRSNPISPVELMEYGTIDAEQLAYLWLLMEYKFSILVSGGTAVGKTTILNCLCSFIPTEYKIVSIEDTAEINLMHPNWVQSVTRAGFGTSDSSTSTLSGVSGISVKTPGDISLYDLLVAALRQRPDFIIVGEVRGAEAFTLFQAIAVGHAALGTIHAGSMDELLARVESNPMNVPRALLINVDVVLFPVHIKKGERGQRRMQNITEVLELERESDNIITNTAYQWDPVNDLFQFQGKSYLFDKIKDKHGIPVSTLKLELTQRGQLLQWLKKNRIRNYYDVVSWIRKYYTEREQVMAEIGGDTNGIRRDGSI